MALEGRSFKPQLERGSFLCRCGHVLLVVRDDERDETDCTRVRDSHIRHKNPPLSPAPRPSSIAAQYKDPCTSSTSGAIFFHAATHSLRRATARVTRPWKAVNSHLLVLLVPMQHQPLVVALVPHGHAHPDGRDLHVCRFVPVDVRVPRNFPSE